MAMRSVYFSTTRKTDLNFLKSSTEDLSANAPSSASLISYLLKMVCKMRTSSFSLMSFVSLIRPTTFTLLAPSSAYSTMAGMPSLPILENHRTTSLSWLLVMSGFSLTKNVFFDINFLSFEFVVGSPAPIAALKISKFKKCPPEQNLRYSSSAREVRSARKVEYMKTMLLHFYQASTI